MKHKATTIKQHQERINRVTIYIQQHLDKDITLAELEKVSHFSRYHFHRIFAAYHGETLSSYVRRLRLQHAAKMLIYTDILVTDIALNAHFETPSSFTKAFKQLTGLSPKGFRARGLIQDYRQCQSPDNSTTGVNMKQPILKTLDEQDVIFIRRTGSYFESAPAAWKAMGTYFTEKKRDDSGVRLIGIAHDDPSVTNEEKWRFDACVAGLEKPTMDGEVGVQTIAGGKYARFEHIGPYNTMGDTYRAIFGEWYPSSGASLRDEPTFAQYVDRTFSNDYGGMSDEQRAKLKTHIFVPIN